MIDYTPIGLIHTPHQLPDHTPIQSVYADHSEGWIEVYPDYAEGLTDLDGFSHLYLLYHFHRAKTRQLTVIPYMADHPTGVFATRSPLRPNPIGLSIVELIRQEGLKLIINRVDMLDQTPLLDIKPYTRKFDTITPTRNGWQDRIDEETARYRGSRHDQKGCS